MPQLNRPEMRPERAKRLARTRKLVVPGIIACIAVIVVLWVLGLATSVNAETFSLTRTSWFALAAVATLAGPPLIFFAVRNYLYLLEHGIEVEGEVVKIAKIPLVGRRPVTYVYKVAGTEYSLKRDTDPSIKKLAVGSKVELLVDPRKPSNAVIYG